MIDKGSDQPGSAKISEGKMQFTVVHRRPQYSEREKEAAKAEIEKALFAVFSQRSGR